MGIEGEEFINPNRYDYVDDYDELDFPDDDEVGRLIFPADDVMLEVDDNHMNALNFMQDMIQYFGPVEDDSDESYIPDENDLDDEDADETDDYDADGYEDIESDRDSDDELRLCLVDGNYVQVGGRIVENLLDVNDDRANSVQQEETVRTTSIMSDSSENPTSSLDYTNTDVISSSTKQAIDIEKRVDQTSSTEKTIDQGGVGEIIKDNQS